jgi:hypothetical protein
LRPTYNVKTNGLISQAVCIYAMLRILSSAVETSFS